MAMLMMKMSSCVQMAYALAGNVVEQTVGAIRTVTSFTGEKDAIKKYDRELKVAYEATVTQGLASGLGLGTLILIIFSTYGLAIFHGSKLIVKKNYSGGQVLNVIMAMLAGGISFATSGTCNGGPS